MAKKLTIAFIFTFFLVSVFCFITPSSLASIDCLKITYTSSEDDKNFCRKELSDIEAQLDALLRQQKEEQKKTGTLKGDLDYLTSQISALKTKIKARNLKIAEIKLDIREKVEKIEDLSEKIEKEYESLAQLLRNTNDFDNKNFVYLLFSDENLSIFYNDLESYASIKQAISASVKEIHGIKAETEQEKTSLEKKQDDETDAKAELENAEKKVVLSETEKKRLLAISKERESTYGKLAAEKKVQADKIRAALFPLRDAEAIPFGTALQYAEEAEKKTGVRPAFILAILKQETNLGANVGSCVITDLSSGSTKGLNSGRIFTQGIHPTRDLPALQQIVEGLGRNSLDTRISCPLLDKNGKQTGYGGAMGPAQFIPSTWNLIKSQLTKVLDKDTPDPWSPHDAIMASAILLKNNGASTQGYSAERNAACKYYSGRGCTDPSVKNVFYGNAVMALATQIQANIDLLSN